MWVKGSHKVLRQAWSQGNINQVTKKGLKGGQEYKGRRSNCQHLMSQI